MRLDPYGLRDALLRSILHEVGRSETEFDPSVAAWAVYALLQEERPLGDPARLLKLLRRERERWLVGDIAGRELVAIAALQLLESTTHTEAQSTLELLLTALDRFRVAGRLSALRLPEQLFIVSLALKGAEPGARNRLAATIRGQIGGPTHRRVLLQASLVELEGGLPPVLDLSGDDVADAIARLWWQIRYAEGTDAIARWEELDALLPSVDFGGAEASLGEGRRVLGPWEKGLLYECLCKELRAINPRTLFNLYPLHPRVKRIVQQHFEQGKYPSAITQAVQVLNELLQKKVEDRSIGERELVNKYLHGKPPKYVLNDQYDDRAGRDEHEGVTMLIEGVFTGLRNPRGHRPEDDALLANSPYEAFDQIVLISYLTTRVEHATRYVAKSKSPGGP
jgi:uncharacterized protein (TIGR02391 family)